eukprot:g3059.t1
MCVAPSSNAKPAGRGGAPAAQSEESSGAALEDHDQRALSASRRIRWPLWGHDKGHDHKGGNEPSFAREVAASLKREGIAVVRNVIPAELVRGAREDAIAEQENLLNRLDVQQDARVLRVLEHENLAKLIKEALMELMCNMEDENSSCCGAGDEEVLLAEDKGSRRECEESESKREEPLHQDQHVPAVETTTFKWLRCVKEKLYTGLHQDLFYLGNDNYLTAWIPFLDNTDLKHGALTWLADDDERTTVVSSSAATTRSSCSNNGTTAGWLDLDASKFPVPPGKVWRSTSFQAGDVAIFDMRLLHMTVPNLSGINRISCDTRWRLASCRGARKLSPELDLLVT